MKERAVISPGGVVAADVRARLQALYAGMAATLVLVLAAQSTALDSSAQPTRDVDLDLLARLKAAAVSHLPGHTEWPEGHFEDSNEENLDPIVIAFVGEDGHGFEHYLRDAIRDRRVQERPLILRRLLFPLTQPDSDDISPEDLARFQGELRQAHVLYIGLSERARARDRLILEWIEDRSILTVSSIVGFVDHRGGMIGLTVRENRLAMDINVDLIRERDLRVSSRVLRLARIVTLPESDSRSGIRN